MCVCMAYPFNRKSYTFDNDTLDLWQRSFKTLNEGTNPLEKRGKHLWIRKLFELWIFGYFKEKLITRLFIISLSSQSKNYAMKKHKKNRKTKLTYSYLVKNISSNKVGWIIFIHFINLKECPHIIINIINVQ